jgi:hypothetical protein
VDRPIEPIHRWRRRSSDLQLRSPDPQLRLADPLLRSPDSGSVGEDQAPHMAPEKEKTGPRRRRRSTPPALEENHAVSTPCRIRRRRWIPLLLPLPDGRRRRESVILTWVSGTRHWALRRGRVTTMARPEARCPRLGERLASSDASPGESGGRAEGRESGGRARKGRRIC